MKIRFLVILAILAGLISPAYSAGTIPGMSLSQQFDTLGKPLNGCKLYTYAAGTSTPQSVYQDSALTIPWPNPLTCDSAGRLPQLFAADGSIKIRLSNSAGVTQVAADGILIVGPSGGGGGGSPVDATTILATGDLKFRYGTGVLTGFVRANGRTIGSATSGATERANTDCQALFEYLWGADANLSVSGGRGASANADWVANKTLSLPDWRGRVPAGLDDMGAASASRLASIMSSTVLGASGGSQNQPILQTNLPSYNLTVTDTHRHGIEATDLGYGSATAVSAPSLKTNGAAPTGTTHYYDDSGNFDLQSHLTAPTTSGSIVVSSAGGGASLTTTPPIMLATFYLKL